MSGSNNRPSGGKRPNSPRYSERYGKGHVNPYLAGQPRQDMLYKEIEERQNAVRAENELEARRAEERASRTAASGARQEAQRGAEAGNGAQPSHSAPVRKKAREKTMFNGAVKDPKLQERLREIQEQAMLEARAFREDSQPSDNGFDDMDTTPDVKLKLSEDNKPLIALESRDSDGRLNVRWVPVVLSDEEMEAFFPGAEQSKDSRGIKLEEKKELEAKTKKEKKDSRDEDELVLIPMEGEDKEPPAAKKAEAAAAVEILESAPAKKEKRKEAPGGRSYIDSLPAITLEEAGVTEEPEVQPEPVSVPIIIAADRPEDKEDEPGEDNSGDEESDAEPEVSEEPEEETEAPTEETGDPEEEPEDGEEEAEAPEEEPSAEDTSAEEPEEEEAEGFQPEDSEEDDSSEAQPEEESEPEKEPEETSEEDSAQEEAVAESPEDDPEKSEEEPETTAADAPAAVEDISAGEPAEEEAPAERSEAEEQPKKQPGQIPERPRHKRRRSRPDDVAAAVEEEPSPEETSEDEDPAGKRTAVAASPLYDDLNASDRYTQRRYLEAVRQDDSLFIRKRRPGNNALFPTADGARMPKYIDDDDFVERWLGNEEEEDMASETKRRRRRISTFIGAATMVLALIGFIAIARWGIGLLSGIGNTDTQKSEYAEFISPIVMSEVPVFETWDAIPQDKLLQSAVFSVLEDMDVTYERDDTGKFIIPSTDIVNAVKELYGAYSTDPAQDEEINTQIRNALYGSAGEDTTNTDVYYVDMEDSFHVADGLSGPAPEVTDISRRDETITLVVQYLEDLEGGSGGILYAREYILTLDGDGYFVKAIREYEE